MFMSMWSGKCDFYDHLEISSVKENFEKFKNNTKLYKWNSDIDDKKEEIKFETFEDLIPYFTHLVSIAVNVNGKQNIILSSKSWLENDQYCPTQYRLSEMQRFDKFVRESGKTPLWNISPEEMLTWAVCPLNEPYFCEFNRYKLGRDGKKEHLCPYMYSRKQKGGNFCKKCRDKKIEEDKV